MPMIQSSQIIGFSINSTPTIMVAELTIPIDVVFSGYREEYINQSILTSGLDTRVYYQGVDNIYNETSEEYTYLLNLDITIDYNFHFTSESYDAELDSFITTNSWDAYTSGLNVTKLNLQEETGERQSIFYQQEGRAIDGEAVEQYLVDNSGYSSTDPSYTIYFLNQSHFDTPDHSFEHWFEIDEVDPDSNITTDWWRLEWDNDLNLDVEFPYPCWGSQNRLFFVDPYCHQWYTKWTDIWWNPDVLEGYETYLTQDLDTYLEGYTPQTSAYNSRVTLYLVDYLNDIVSDVGARGDGIIYNEKEISSQVLFINDEAHHGYSQEDLAWIYSEDEIQESFEYVIPKEVGNITLETNWVELSETPQLNQIINDNIMDEDELGSYPWYRSDWTYLNGIGIFYAFQAVAEDYFDLDKGDSTFTDWVLLLQNVSMVAQAYGEYKEFTGLGGVGNVVCFKDLNRYYASDGLTPRSGVTTLLVHEIGHVLGFLHAEIRDDATEGTGGFMRDVMSYYSEGTSEFSVFLKDSLYRTSSIAALYRTRPILEEYLSTSNAHPDVGFAYEDIISEGEAALDEMDYVTAFLLYRQLYDLVDSLSSFSTTNIAAIHPILTLLFIMPVSLVIIHQKRKY